MRRLRLAIALGATLALIAGGVALARPAPQANSGSPVFVAQLSGDSELPAVDTNTSGMASFRVQGGELGYLLEIEDGVDIFAVAGAHIHCGAEDENGPVAVFLAGAIPPNGLDGDIRIGASIDDDSILPTDCGDTLGELVQSMRDGLTYVNVHSAANPSGEVRGQIHQRGR